MAFYLGYIAISLWCSTERILICEIRWEPSTSSNVVRGTSSSGAEAIAPAHCAPRQYGVSPAQYAWQGGPPLLGRGGCQHG